MKKNTIEIKKIESLYSSLPASLVVLSALSLIIYYVFSGHISQENRILWLVLNFALVLSRALSYISFKRANLNSTNLSKYYILFFTLSTISALIWGTSAFYMVPDLAEYKALIIIFILGLISGAVVNLSIKLKVFYFYLYASLLPYLYVFLTDDTESSEVYALSLVFFIFSTTVIAKRNSDAFNRNLHLAYENADLVSQLEEKIEEAVAANKAKSDFLSAMSHEIRTPLNAIMGFVQILKKDETDEKKYKYLDTIDKSSVLLTNVINDILDISKIESGKFTLEMREFNPQEEFSSLYQLFKQNALEKNVILVNNISTQLPQTLRSDVLRIKQIVSNLLSNAIKFTPAGKHIYMIVDFDEASSSLSVSIKDEGIGISKENISVVTQAFTQADNSISRKYGGTGLGLSIVTNLLSLLGSEMSIESEVDKGSSFSFTIKMECVENFTEEEGEDLEQELFYPNKRILVAEDNKMNQMLISILLEDMQIDVVLANDGQIAENLYKESSFDMVLMDINMPIKDGLDAMKAIKMYEKETEHTATPIIALTANAVSGDKQKYLEEGFDGYLAKPIELDELKSILKQFFSN